MRLTGTARRRAVVAAYATWRSECFAVHHAYRAWRRASSLEESIAFHAYTAALDREEGAAARYATLVRRTNTVSGPGLMRS
jgi:hypothetical protein